MVEAQLQYGTGNLTMEIPSSDVTVLRRNLRRACQTRRRPSERPCATPSARQPLGRLVGAKDRVAVVIPDITRALPRERLLPWLLEELSHVPPDNVTIVNGTGSHRTNTEEELAEMVGEEVYANYRVVNHNAHDPETLAFAGSSPEGREVYMNRQYVEADRRIVLGFIEPHFMAGFSGGYKGVFPAVADVDSIMHYHRAAVIGHERSTWGVLEDNPTQDQIRANGSLLPVDFCVNVTLNRSREITGFYCGDVLAAHAEGLRGKQGLRDGGLRPGVSDRRHHQRRLPPGPEPLPGREGHVGRLPDSRRRRPDHLRRPLQRRLPEPRKLPRDAPGALSPGSDAGDHLPPGFSRFDQWQVQLFAQILQRARVALYSEIDAEDVRSVHLEPVADISARISEELRSTGEDTPVAVLPEGPMAVPFLERAEASL